MKNGAEQFDSVKKLADEQVVAFDTEYVSDARWEVIKRLVETDFPDGDFRFLDVGGGNGVFADRLLDAFPRCRGTVVDNSELLLNRNAKNERKELLNVSVESLGTTTDTYDLVCIHWVLHHLVSDSYAGTRRNQALALGTLSRLLTDRGRISVYENLCEGWILADLPGWLIYQATSSRALAGITRRFGANTAGVGVCFLSERQWRMTAIEANLEVISSSQPDPWVWPLRPLWRAALHLKRMTIGHFWLGPRTPQPEPPRAAP